MDGDKQKQDIDIDLEFSSDDTYNKSVYIIVSKSFVHRNLS